MNWYFQAFGKYAVFAGRARRSEYWYFFLFNVIAALVLAMVDAAIGTFDLAAGIGVLSGLYYLAALIPALAVTVRRLHDTGRSGWWALIPLVPLVGAIALLVFTLQDSEPGENRHGPNPKLSGTTPATLAA